jgi:mono/diheme cytochrome c family protein
MFLAAVMSAVFAPAPISAQNSRKDAGSKSGVSAPANQQADSGKDLFNQHCASCHFTDTTAQKIGPGLKGLYARLTFSDGKKVSDVSLTKWIEAGGKDMPGFKETMKPEQIRALVSYIKTL